MNIYLAIFLAVLFMFVIPSMLIVKISNYKILKIICFIFSIMYFVCLSIGVIGKIEIQNNNFLISFNFNKPWFSLYFLTFNFSWSNIFLNLIMLFPIGFIVYVFAKKNVFIKTIFITAIISISIEVLQFILPIHRNSEIFDFLLNCFSGLLSAIYCYYIVKLRKKER